jgi:hypothetical protein
MNLSGIISLLCFLTACLFKIDTEAKIGKEVGFTFCVEDEPIKEIKKEGEQVIISSKQIIVIFSMAEARRIAHYVQFGSQNNERNSGFVGHRIRRNVNENGKN